MGDAIGGAASNIGNRILAGMLGFTNSTAPIEAVGNLIGGVATGQRTDPRGVAESVLDRLGRGAADNSNLLLGLGGDIMSGRYRRSGFQGAMQGADLDQRQVAARRQEQAIVQWLQGKGFSPAEIEAAAANPTLAKAMIERAFAPPRAGVNINDRLVDPVTGEVRADFSGTKPPVTQDFETPDGGKESRQWNPASQRWEPIAGLGAGAPANPYAVGGKTTEDERKNVGFANRMFAAERVFRDPQIIDQQTNLRQQGFEQVPGVGNYLTSGAKQRATRAEKDFVTAVLRRESGATIREEEFANEALKYFPRPGDSESVLRDKRDARIEAMRAVAAGAGRFYRPPYLFDPQGNISEHGGSILPGGEKIVGYGEWQNLPKGRRIREMR
jgi:hypothetical protein